MAEASGSYTATGNPLAIKRSTMGAPMAPTPMNPMAVCVVKFCSKKNVFYIAVIQPTASLN
jgi:hypothetical protein